MTAPTAWASLPNAPHIDRILADLKARPDVWGAARVAAWGAARVAAWDAARAAAWDAAWAAAWGAARDAARDATWDAARDAARDATWDAARDATWGAAREAAREAARDAARAAAWALIAWDDVAYILTLPPDAVQMLIETCTDHHKHAAALLLPACIALKGDRDARH